MRLYADEQYPYPVVKCLRELGHDVLTVQEAGKANQRIPDEEVLAFATENNRAVIT
jgi:predicted nuclease of predicted toxin-antitoxin system